MAPHKHEIIADKVRADLGEPGQSVPPEEDLAERHDVSRHTVRQALERLEAEGRIVTTLQGGRRRIVRDIRRYRYDMNTLEQRHGSGIDAWTATMLEQGAENPETDVEVHIVTTTPDIAAILAVEPGRPIITRRRVHLVAGYPHLLSDSYYPRWVTDGFDDFMQPSNVSAPGGLLAASGHRQGRFQDLIATRLPTPEETTILRMPATIPLLIHTRTGYDGQNRPVRLEVRRMPSDQVEVIYNVPNT